MIKKSLILLFSSRLLFLIFAVAGTFLVTARTGYLGINLSPENDHYLLWIWSNFDGKHYINIAQFGYQRFDFAFFPLYSVLILGISKILSIHYIPAGIIISTLSFFGGMVFLYKICLIDFDKRVASLALFFISFFPLSFFYHSVYTDSLFLLLTTASFYFARKKQWVWAGIFGGLSTATRLTGMALLPALAVEWYLQNRTLTKELRGIIILFLKKAAFPLTLATSGFLAYALYLHLNYGSWLLFQKSMVAWSQDKFIFPPQVIFRYLKIFFSVSPGLLEYWIAVLEFVSFFAYLFIAVYVWTKVRISYGVFMVILLILVTFTGTLAGNPRYILHLFPAFIGLSLLVRNKKPLKYAITAIFIALGFILTIIFTRGYFVT
ncbi:hypothetical protein A3A14_04625 [Candidatus Daviesbacteria bacterium RIFCSPLOWO2_01_FULL_43_38]|uniref:Glycosyltransferase RgtA/B/C/D-like domain-containing protein n=2 Tax=Candidatus Daviesiibacteriota TaxID=1752718 RepID=A0A1F5K0B5_9BACT|nr:MAG: hypothetical protein UV33_C0004G0003 [Candidatus Daviesbacteria bacterium GW2011_GWA1_42_6]OGE34306.1 MAG: hypothetical protein A3E45_04970 [Candidatus Daviesbacteria bacterium RIFCSPHIGHO2_12_FULL_43_11]OGE63816.1 MAG: hypothetical protein A3A14_04625 [Candidatus Daviesbacteria bacterium RIFCSPLOWO2_01_FULL_43_38]OGE69113.1 MAG: hypothetical protein A3J21_00675 [Candidatus Daviesbacteria bacterium RIFCSPLOWO2_02_FULL_43_11]